MATDVPIVDGAIAYDCITTGETYILLVRNSLYIPSMESNLIHLFIMRMGGVIVRDTLKIHCDHPSINNHCILFKESLLRIPMQLSGTFSFFHTRIPLAEELYNCDKIFLIPDFAEWNTHCDSFARNE